eukprot:gene18708-19009_t
MSFSQKHAGRRMVVFGKVAMLLGGAAAAMPAPASAQIDIPAILREGEVLLAKMTSSDRPQVTGIAAERTAAIVAANRALSPENAVPTSFQNPVSLDDADVVARARVLSDQAGHNGLHYDYFRFRVAMEKLRQTKGDKLDIPKATYRLYPPDRFPAGQGVVEVSGLSHVVIDGHGSTLLFYYVGNSSAPLTNVHPRAGIHLLRSDHIVVRDLVLDWPEPMAVPVRINGSGRDGHPQTMTVDPAFPIDPGSPMPIAGFIPFDVKNHRFLLSRDRDPDDFSAWQAQHARGGAMPYTCPSQNTGASAAACFRYTGGQTYTFGPNEHFYPVPVKNGNFLATVRDNNFAAVVGDGLLSYVTLSGLTIYSSPGAGIQFIGSGPALRITHCRIVRKPDALLLPGEQRRFLSTVADGVNFISTAGDLVLEDSEIADQGDDGLNVNATLRLGKATGPNTLLAPKLGVPNFYRVGGVIDVLDEKARNMVTPNATIDAVLPPSAGDPAHVGLTLGHLQAPMVAGRTYQLSIHDFDSSRVLVRNNWFHDNSERGVVVHGRDFAVVGNRFDRTAESAIEALHDDANLAAEGKPADNLVISGNVINDVNVQWFDTAAHIGAPPAAISVYFGSRSAFSENGSVVSSNNLARHIVISDNSIDQVPGVGILVSQAQDVLVTGNRVTRSNMHAFGLPLVDDKSIIVESTNGLNYAGNATDGRVAIPGR